MSKEINDRLRELPSVDEVMQRLQVRCPNDVLAAETRRIIEEARTRIRHGQVVEVFSIPERVLAALHALEQPSLRRVINATGVVLHTNLGRAPLPRVNAPEGYSNLEYDIASGRRGKRDVHAGPLFERLLGHPAVVVNNNAAAIYLALNELAAGFEVIVSRGELIEIGDGFRIPDIMARSGAILREVGTTNRTRIDDYRGAINERTRLILRVHPSNFHISGFTSKPDLRELADLGREHGIPVYEDLGSGLLVDLRQYGISEPAAADSLKAGVDLISFSGDKLLGGPQAGILAGREELVTRLRRNPMFRALRCDKMVYAALEATLRNTLFCRWENVPAMRMIMTPLEEIRDRATALVDRASLPADVVPGRSVIGGGSTPDQALPTWLIAIKGCAANDLERALREGEPAVIARIDDDRVLIDLRTVFVDEEEELAAALKRALDTIRQKC